MADAKRSDKAKANDGRISLPQAARIAGLPQNTLHSWVASDLIEPNNEAHGKPGTGNHRRFDLRDLTAICVCAELRRKNVNVRSMRFIQTRLRELGQNFANARLALVAPNQHATADVAILHGDRDRANLAVSLLDKPGQILIAEIDLAPVARHARSAHRNVLKEKPAVRGRRPGQTAKRGESHRKVGTG